MGAPVLAMDDVGVSLPRHGRLVPVLTGLSLRIGAGEMLALVGESGSGKTTAALAVPRLLPAGALLTGRMAFCGTDMAGLDAAGLRSVRGRRIGIAFQDALAALNPVHPVGAQVAERLRLHLGLPRRAAAARAVALLAEMGIERAAERTACYPHQLSGGLRQRAQLALALACGPDLLIADEATTGLDPALKTQILGLIRRRQAASGMAVLLVSHDMALVRAHADSVHVLYAGRSAEAAAAGRFFAAPRHPYARALLLASPAPDRAPQGIPGRMPAPEDVPPGCAFQPRCAVAEPACCAIRPAMVEGVACLNPQAGPLREGDRDAPVAAAASAAPLLEVGGLAVRYRSGLLGRATVAALHCADLAVGAGECVAVIGPSGSGKTSLGRAIAQMIPHDGSTRLDAAELERLRGGALRRMRRRIGVVFQDPCGSLNPLMTAGAIVGEALALAGVPAADRPGRAAGLLEELGLPAKLASAPSSSLSGGQAQRVAIARTLAADPLLLVLDEPTACLDLSSQALVLCLLRDLVRRRRLGCIVITHDLAAVAFLADRVLVMKGGVLRGGGKEGSK